MKTRRYLLPSQLKRGRIIGAAFYPETSHRSAVAGFLTGNPTSPENPTSGFATNRDAWELYISAVKAAAQRWAEERSPPTPPADVAWEEAYGNRTRLSFNVKVF